MYLMVKKSAKWFIFGIRRTGTHSPDPRLCGLSIDMRGIRDLIKGEDEQLLCLMKFAHASSFLWERGQSHIGLVCHYNGRWKEWYIGGPFLVQIQSCLLQCVSTAAGQAKQGRHNYSITDLNLLQYTCTNWFTLIRLDFISACNVNKARDCSFFLPRTSCVITFFWRDTCLCELCIG